MSLVLHGTLFRRRSLTVAEAGSRAVLRLRDGDQLAVDVDAENGSYLRASFEPRSFWFERRRHTKRYFAWFGTTDAFLIGVDLAAVSAIEWLPANVAAPAATQFDRDHLVLRFRDRPALQLPRIAWDDIARLRGATICERDGDPLELMKCTGAGGASIATEALVLATLPARWMDEDLDATTQPLALDSASCSENSTIFHDDNDASCTPSAGHPQADHGTQPRLSSNWTP